MTYDRRADGAPGTGVVVQSCMFAVGPVVPWVGRESAVASRPSPSLRMDLAPWISSPQGARHLTLWRMRN